MFGKVRHIIGGEPEPEKKIMDMQKGESGYTVPWAYRDGVLDTDFPILEEKGGTASLWVECVAPGEYVLEFEQPRYRNIFTG